MEVYSCEYMVDGQQLGFIGKSTITTTGLGMHTDSLTAHSPCSL